MYKLFFLIPIFMTLLIVVNIIHSDAEEQEKPYFRATIYSDGFACPNKCDVHFVVHSKHNPSANIFAEGSNRTDPIKCKHGRKCWVCFDNYKEKHAGNQKAYDKNSECILLKYRGSGPPKGVVDFTPSFYKEFCNKLKKPKVIDKVCRKFSNNFKKITKNKTHCALTPSVPVCKDIIQNVLNASKRDSKYRNECIRLGQKKYNEKYFFEKYLQRSYNCNYERSKTGGPNSNNIRWKRLLPASCRPKTYIGKNGLDCCGSDKYTLGALGNECSIYIK